MATPSAPAPATPADPLLALRRAMAARVRRVLIGTATPVRDLSAPVSGDPGLFGPESASWRVHGDAAVLIGGIRALLLQTLHPLAMAGVADHSVFRSDPTGRLWRTAAYVGTTTYGTTEQAERAVAQVRRVHERVRGTAPDGRPYSANDPHLLAWVHHTLVESFLFAHRRFGGAPLSDGDADRYVDEQARLAELIGGVDPPPARSVAGLAAWMDAIRPELAVTPAARDAVRFLLLPPLPATLRPPYTVIASAAVGLLPGWARRQLWLPRLPATEHLAVRPAAWALTRTLDWALKAPLPAQQPA